MCATYFDAAFHHLLFKISFFVNFIIFLFVSFFCPEPTKKKCYYVNNCTNIGRLINMYSYSYSYSPNPTDPGPDRLCHCVTLPVAEVAAVTAAMMWPQLAVVAAPVAEIRPFKVPPIVVCTEAFRRPAPSRADVRPAEPILCVSTIQF